MALDAGRFQQKLAEATKTGKLNLGFCELTSLPATYIKDIKVLIASAKFIVDSHALVRFFVVSDRASTSYYQAAIPNLQELDLRSNHLQDLPRALSFQQK